MMSGMRDLKIVAKRSSESIVVVRSSCFVKFFQRVDWIVERVGFLSGLESSLLGALEFADSMTWVSSDDNWPTRLISETSEVASGTSSYRFSKFHRLVWRGGLTAIRQASLVAHAHGASEVEKTIRSRKCLDLRSDGAGNEILESRLEGFQELRVHCS